MPGKEAHGGTLNLRGQATRVTMTRDFVDFHSNASSPQRGDERSTGCQSDVFTTACSKQHRSAACRDVGTRPRSLPSLRALNFATTEVATRCVAEESFWKQCQCARPRPGCDRVRATGAMPHGGSHLNEIAARTESECRDGKIPVRNLQSSPRDCGQHILHWSGRMGSAQTTGARGAGQPVLGSHHNEATSTQRLRTTLNLGWSSRAKATTMHHHDNAAPVCTPSWVELGAQRRAIDPTIRRTNPPCWPRASGRSRQRGSVDDSATVDCLDSISHCCRVAATSRRTIATEGSKPHEHKEHADSARHETGWRGRSHKCSIQVGGEGVQLDYFLARRPVKWRNA